MRHRVVIQTVTQTPDGAGGFTENWTTAATVWASIQPANGRERWVAGQMETHVTHRIECRYNSAITTAMRILWGARVFDVVEVLNIEERNILMRIMAVEGTQ